MTDAEQIEFNRLALAALEGFETVARDIISHEHDGPLFQRKWSGALAEAKAIIAALDYAREHGIK